MVRGTRNFPQRGKLRSDFWLALFDKILFTQNFVEKPCPLAKNTSAHHATLQNISYLVTPNRFLPTNESVIKTLSKIIRSLITLGLTLSVGIFIGIAVNFTWNWYTKINTDEIKLFLRYAQGFTYSDSTTYKGADSDNPSRIIDESIPLKVNEEYRTVFGVLNNNSKPIDDVMLRLRFTKGFEVIEPLEKGWIFNGNREYYTPLGNINSGVGHNTIQGITFKAKKLGPLKIEYVLSGRGFKAFTNKVVFDVY